jgi:ribonuclease E
MANKMLIDATHPEETRVVVVRGNRVEEFDFESANRRPLRGNIYLAKVTRVEPSLQACFVDYGGNRHGFLAFSEIHPDYYQIPVADRQALIAEEERAARAESEQDRAPREQPKEAGAAEVVSQLPAEDSIAAGDVPEPEMVAEVEQQPATIEPIEDAAGLSLSASSGEENGAGNGAQSEASETPQEVDVVESVGAGEALEEVPERRYRSRGDLY